MKNYESLQNLIERADRLMRLKATGTADEFAATLDISRASVFRLLEYMKSIGAPINYCSYSKTYYYEYPVKVEFTCKVLKIKEMDGIYGGKCFDSNIYKYSDVFFENIF